MQLKGTTILIAAGILGIGLEVYQLNRFFPNLIFGMVNPKKITNDWFNNKTSF